MSACARPARRPAHRLVGRKTGPASPAVRRQSGVGQPDSGTLLSDTAVADGGAPPPPHRHRGTRAGVRPGWTRSAAVLTPAGGGTRDRGRHPGRPPRHRGSGLSGRSA
ncbi:hypothetical protein GFH48_10415 [Streptomyces fagopyri]|uniref:Uncharacterized protein n=1 Tax=Streptomyces fagopyri TaxID=2662397 RepID=A0A5Q0LAN3_9ACTN|nr:hypothetical protein GFH48_10415 [Streptomyces fagopyri]